MNKADSTIEITEVSEKMTSVPTENKPDNENIPTPLIRYFTITDEVTESYVLGYN